MIQQTVAEYSMGASFYQYENKRKMDNFPQSHITEGLKNLKLTERIKVRKVKE